MTTKKRKGEKKKGSGGRLRKTTKEEAVVKGTPNEMDKKKLFQEEMLSVHISYSAHTCVILINGHM
jgi:hypothetical protein